MTRLLSHVSVSTYYVGAETLRQGAPLRGSVVSSPRLSQAPETTKPLGLNEKSASRLNVSGGETPSSPLHVAGRSLQMGKPTLLATAAWVASRGRKAAEGFWHVSAGEHEEVAGARG